MQLRLKGQSASVSKKKLKKNSNVLQRSRDWKLRQKKSVSRKSLKDLRGKGSLKKKE